MKIKITKLELLDILSESFGQKVGEVEISDLPQAVLKQLEFLNITYKEKPMKESELLEIIKRGIKIS